MGTKLQILLTVAFVLFGCMHFFTSYSLVGFWSDGLVTLAFGLFAVWSIINTKIPNRILKWFIRTANLIGLVLILSFTYSHITNPFVIDTLKLRGFYFVHVNDKWYNAYFKPVGAYSGGQGNFWIAEVPKYFPVIEHLVYYEHAVHHDFGKDMDFEMNPIDNREVVRNYINRAGL